MDFGPSEKTAVINLAASTNPGAKPGGKDTIKIHGIELGDGHKGKF